MDRVVRYMIERDNALEAQRRLPDSAGSSNDTVAQEALESRYLTSNPVNDHTPSGQQCNHEGKMNEIGGSTGEPVQCYDTEETSRGLAAHHTEDSPGVICRDCYAEYCQQCAHSHITIDGKIPEKVIRS